jgi:hypothetical protein
MGVARGAAVVVVLALVTGVGVAALAMPGFETPAAGAAVAAKKLKACSVVTPLELSPIFEIEFRKGIADDAGACNFRKKVLVKKDDVVVSIIPERFSSVKRAKRSFAAKLATTTELMAAEPEVVQAGNDAFYTLFIGTDLLTMRVGDVVIEVRVENNDDDEATYHDQIVAVGQAIALHLATTK